MTAIEFENISKQYRLGLVSTRTLSHDLKRWYAMNIQGKDDPYLKIGEVNDRAHRGESEYVWALKDINFKVEQGDVLGIIGKNGAGKSTLLKILSKVTTPSTGTIKARGRIASLLEVGTGFHPEMTGRENIYMNGAIMGMTKAEISRKFDEIVDFSGVERYIDTPAKRYSSGMTVRLGFAIAAHLDPEILVVDEVLAVGDAEFQKKAIGKMQDVSKGEGRTVLFVSHNMASIMNLCKNGILLENGSIKMAGQIGQVVDFYQRISLDVLNHEVSSRKDRSGNQLIKVVDCTVTDPDGQIIDSVVVGNSIDINVTLDNRDSVENIHNLIVTANICDSYGNRICHLSTYYKAMKVDVRQKKIQLSFSVDRFALCQGTYYVGFYIAGDFGIYDWIENVISFNCDDGDFFGTGNTTHSGIFLMDHTIRQL